MREEELNLHLNKKVKLTYREEQHQVTKIGYLKYNNSFIRLGGGVPYFLLRSEESGIVEGVFDAYSVIKVEEI